MNQESAMKYIKALAGVLTLIGITVSPEHQTAIAAGFMALYSIVTAFQGWIKTKTDK